MIHSGPSPAKRENLVTRCIAGETVIVPVLGGVGTLDCIFTLNEPGTRIWQLIDGATAFGEIVDTICREYDVPSEAAKNDVAEFLSSLEEAGLICPPEPDAGR